MQPGVDFLLRFLTEADNLVKAAESLKKVEEQSKKAADSITADEEKIERATKRRSMGYRKTAEDAGAAAAQVKRETKEMAEAVFELGEAEERVEVKRRQRKGTGTGGKGMAEEAVAVGEGMNKAAAGTKLFETVAGTAANSANRSRFVMFQMTSAAQDLAIVMQNGGTLDRALLGAANNFGVLFSTMSPLYAVLGTIAVIAVPSLVKAFQSAEQATVSWSSRVKTAIDDVHRLKNAALDLRDAQRQAETARAETRRDTGTKEQIAGRVDLEKHLAEVLRERAGMGLNLENLEAKLFEDKMKRIDAEEAANKRMQQEGVANTAIEAGRALSRRQEEATKTIREGGLVGSPADIYKEFGVRGEINEMLKSLGKNVANTRYSEEVNQYLKGSEQERAKRIGELARDAIEKAAAQGEKAIAKLPESLRDAATAQMELRKQTEDGAKAARERAKAEAAEEAGKIVRGEDLEGLKRVTTPEGLADIAKEARERAEAEANEKKAKADRKFEEEERHGREQDRMSRLSDRLSIADPRSPGFLRGRERQEAEEQLKQFGNREQRRHREEQEEERRLQHDKDSLKHDTEKLNRDRAIQELLGPGGTFPTQRHMPVLGTREEVANAALIVQQQLLGETKHTNELLERMLNGGRDSGDSPKGPRSGVTPPAGAPIGSGVK